jgi:hypothetical protein
MKLKVIVNNMKLRIWKETVVAGMILGLDVSYSECDFVVSQGSSPAIAETSALLSA